MKTFRELLFACVTAALFLSVASANARRVSLEGVGIIIRPINKTYRYKSDHLDTDNWNLGLVFPKNSIPAQLSGMEYATHDFRPASQDSRTTDRIDRIKADASGDLLIAMPSDAASGNGWIRVNPGSGPDLYLDKIGRNTAASSDPNSPYWLYQRAYTAPGTWVSLPVNSVSTNHPPFVFANSKELFWENPLPLGANGVVITRMPEGGGVTTLANPKLLVRSNGDYIASIRHSDVEGQTSVWRSVDKGVTWTFLEGNLQVNRDSLFEHNGDLYLLGDNLSGSGNTRIYKSTNGGTTWSSATFAGGGGGRRPVSRGCRERQDLEGHQRPWRRGILFGTRGRGPHAGIQLGHHGRTIQQHHPGERTGLRFGKRGHAFDNRGRDSHQCGQRQYLSTGRRLEVGDFPRPTGSR